MKVRVIKSFKDKETKALHKTGEEITVSKERFEEINSAAPGPFVEEIKEKKPAKK
jgi:K+/H+ antiporter YhaU regulatory subunit KhtT